VTADYPDAEHSLRCAFANDYVPLCIRLREGMELHPSEREFLAGYLEGRRQPKGRGASPRRLLRSELHFRLFWYLTEIEKDQPDHAYDRLAEIHKISRRTAISAVKETTNTGAAERIARAEQGLWGKLGEFEAGSKKKAFWEKFLMDRRANILSGKAARLEPV